MREKARISEGGGTTLDSILELGPLPGLSRERIDVKYVVFPFCLVRTVQEEVMGVWEGEVWDWREQRPEDHGQEERMRGACSRSVSQKRRPIHNRRPPHIGWWPSDGISRSLNWGCATPLFQLSSGLDRKSVV